MSFNVYLHLSIKDITKDSDSAREINVRGDKTEQSGCCEIQLLSLLCVFKVI